VDKPTRPKRLAFVAVAVLDGACGQRVQPGARNWRSRLRLLQGSGLLVLLPELRGILPERGKLPGGVGDGTGFMTPARPASTVQPLSRL